MTNDYKNSKFIKVTPFILLEFINYDNINNNSDNSVLMNNVSKIDNKKNLQSYLFYNDKNSYSKYNNINNYQNLVLQKSHGEMYSYTNEHDIKLKDDDFFTLTESITLNNTGNFVYLNEIRVHFLSGYMFDDFTDGLIINMYAKINNYVEVIPNSLKPVESKLNLASVQLLKNDFNNFNLHSTPIYFNGGFFNKYITIKVLSIQHLIELQNENKKTQNKHNIASLFYTDIITKNEFNKNEFYIVKENSKFYNSEFNENKQTLYADFYDVTKTNYETISKNNFLYSNNVLKLTAAFNTSEYLNELSCTLRENTEQDCIEFQGSYNGIIDFQDLMRSLSNKGYYVVHEIHIIEPVGDLLETTNKYIITEQFENETSFLDYNKLRPILKYNSSHFNVKYIFKLVNSLDSSMITRESSLTLYGNKYGSKLYKINVNTNPLKIYNKAIIQGVSTKEIIVTKKQNVYSYITYNIHNIGVSLLNDININNLGQKSVEISNISIKGKNGVLMEIIPGFPNFVKFVLYQKSIFNNEEIWNPININDFVNASYNMYLYFRKNDNDFIKIKYNQIQNEYIYEQNLINTINTTNNLKNGIVTFEIPKDISSIIDGLNNNNFYIVLKNDNSDAEDDVVLYEGLLNNKKYKEFVTKSLTVTFIDTKINELNNLLSNMETKSLKTDIDVLKEQLESITNTLNVVKEDLDNNSVSSFNRVGFEGENVNLSLINGNNGIVSNNLSDSSNNSSGFVGLLG